MNEKSDSSFYDRFAKLLMKWLQKFMERYFKDENENCRNSGYYYRIQITVTSKFNLILCF